MIINCPGSQRFKNPYPENIKCPSCGEDVEIWTDEAQAPCPKCGQGVSRPEEQSCLDWCKYAKECVGDEIYDKYVRSRRKENS